MASELAVVLDNGVKMPSPPPGDDDAISKSASKKPSDKGKTRARATKQNVKTLSTGFGSWNGTPEPRISTGFSKCLPPFDIRFI